MIRRVLVTGLAIISLGSAFAVSTDGVPHAGVEPSVPRPRVGDAGIDWPSFRGPRASGIAEGFATPVTWNVEQSQGVAWKTPIPGLGHSSPIIWKDRVCVATAISGKTDPELKVGLYGNIDPVDDTTPHEWRVICVDKKSGKVAWSKTAHRGVPQIKRHTKATHANSTFSTDGTHLVAFFGSEGLYCYRLSDGRLLWKKDLGLLDSGFFQVPEAQWGFASSPVIHDGRVVVQCDVQKDSFIAAFAIEDGREIWRTPRHDVPTWSTPGILEDEERVQLIANGWHEIAGYDFATGKKLWTMKGGGDIPVPTPIVARGLIFITNAHGDLSPIYAIRPDATGDITLQGNARSSRHIAWSTPREGAYMQTPLVYGEHLYTSKDNGVLSVYEATTGTRLYQQRLADGSTGFTASPVAADGKVYFTGEDGEVHVIKAGPAFEQLAQNRMGEVCMATPAISEGRLYFRTRGHLVAIGD
ncbi:MAG: PQQ-binding-like beta-propeller repeat protein [Luteitalea sp.]|nr:PQQ-binding-like beta-propeller repeat protein [Luteitalea sp.]